MDLVRYYVMCCKAPDDTTDTTNWINVERNKATEHDFITVWRISERYRQPKDQPSALHSTPVQPSRLRSMFRQDAFNRIAKPLQCLVPHTALVSNHRLRPVREHHGVGRIFTG